MSVSMSYYIGGGVYRTVRIGCAGGRRNVRPCRMQERTVQFSDVLLCLESGDGSGTFRSWRQRVPDSLWCWIPCIRNWSLLTDRVVVDWWISDYELILAHADLAEPCNRIFITSSLQVWSDWSPQGSFIADVENAALEKAGKEQYGTPWIHGLNNTAKDASLSVYTSRWVPFLLYAFSSHAFSPVSHFPVSHFQSLPLRQREFIGDKCLQFNATRTEPIVSYALSNSVAYKEQSVENRQSSFTLNMLLLVMPKMPAFSLKRFRHSSWAIYLLTKQVLVSRDDRFSSAARQTVNYSVVT